MPYDLKKIVKQMNFIEFLNLQLFQKTQLTCFAQV